MGASLDNKLVQNQQISLTPKMIQNLKILQMPDIELVQYVNEQLVENPLLEADTDDLTEYDMLGDIDDKDEEDSNPDHKDSEKKDFTEYISKPMTLRQYLVSQIGEYRIPLNFYRIIMYLIECIDENGYIVLNINDTARQLAVSPKMIKTALKIVQSLEPDGVGARGLRECMLIQLRRQGLLNGNIKQIVVNHLELIAEKKYKEISKLTGLSKEQVTDIHKTIRSLNPKPGLAFRGDFDNRYIIPELIVREFNGSYIVIFSNDNFLNVKVGEYYKNILLDGQSSKEVRSFINKKLHQATELINAIEQRKRTILNIAGCIMEYQEEFLRKGYKYLKPLTMKMVADKVELHESTVSRAVNEKYILTPRGTFELKFFFSAGICNEVSNEISANTIKCSIRNLVQNEDKRNPLSDEKIKRILEADNFCLARRTIAKYRCEMGIPSTNLRKEI